MFLRCHKRLIWGSKSEIRKSIRSKVKFQLMVLQGRMLPSFAEKIYVFLTAPRYHIPSVSIFLYHPRKVHINGRFQSHKNGRFLLDLVVPIPYSPIKNVGFLVDLGMKDPNYCFIFTGWWLRFQPLWKIWVRHLGWLFHSQLNGKS